MNDADIDALIRADETRLTRYNPYLELSEAERREVVYQQSKSTGGPCASTSFTPKAKAQNDYLQFTNFPLDGLPLPPAEDKLVREYHDARREQEVRDTIAEEGLFPSGNEGDVDEDLHQARAEMLEILAQEEYNKGLYQAAIAHVQEELMKSNHYRQPPIGANYDPATGAIVSRAERESGYFIQDRNAAGGPRYRTPITNSVLPGPYLTLDCKGKHTRYEALNHRLPVRRSAQSIAARPVSERRSGHFPLPKQHVDDAHLLMPRRDVLPPIEPGTALRHWKHKMGLE